MLENQVQENIFKELKKVNFNLSKQNSFKRRLLLSMVQGIGSVVGATLIAGLVVAFLYRFIASLNTLPIVQKYIP